MSNKAIRKMKEERLCELRNALENGEKAVVTKKFFVSLPTAEAHHQCHPTGREVAIAQRVHPKIVDKIHELVLEGVIDPLEVQRHLNTMFVTLCAANNLQMFSIEHIILNFRTYKITSTKQNEAYSYLY